MKQQREKPISFRGPVVLAIPEGKSQTRRKVKGAEGVIEMREAGSGVFTAVYPGGGNATFRAPYQVGDRLYVKEAWRAPRHCDNFTPSQLAQQDKPPIRYEADGMIISDCGWTGGWGRYRHKRFMPRHFSRIALEVTGVRVERLNSISEEDAAAEGCMPCPPNYEGDCLVAGLFRPYACGFAQLWESIYGSESFDDRWVWVYEFEVLRCQDKG